MDFSEYKEFPFPSKLTEKEEKLKDYFFKLSDDEQFNLLKGCTSYTSFCAKINDKIYG